MESDLIEATQRLAGLDLPFLTELGPLLLAAAGLGVAKDSRSFARVFDVAHALVLRELVHLEADLGVLAIEDRGGKSGRMFLSLTPQGEKILAQGVIS